MRGKSWLEKILLPTLLSLSALYVSSCATIDKIGESCLGKEYYHRVFLFDARFLYDNNKPSIISERTLKEIEYTSLLPANQKP